MAELDFLVHKTDWTQTRFDEPETAPLADGQVRFRVDRFALTANNISYALTGDALGYWRFFLAPEGWGRIPAMGFADVVESKHAGVEEGTRCFGFYPMSRSLVIEPKIATPETIVDGAAHREGLAPAYAQYSPSSSDALYSEDSEDELMLMRGLFLTSFLADDFFADSKYFGAEQVIVSSASSKTAIALAWQVSQGGNARAVGLTSERNRSFVESLGCYDEVLTYDSVASLAPETTSVFVDMAGNNDVLHAVHGHFRDQLKHSCGIGATHWDSERSPEGLAGPTPEFFFAPGQIQKRSKEWGPAELQRRLAEAWFGFRDSSKKWLEIERSQGRQALEEAFAATREGRVPPNKGLVLSLQS